MSDLADLPSYAYVFVMVLARVGSAATLLPGVGEAELPATIRAGLAIALTVLLVPVLQPAMPPLPAGPIALLGDLAAEIATGVWMGWLVRIAAQALQVAGQIIASVSGLSNVLQPDAVLGGQNSVVAHAMGLAAPVLILAGDLHQLPLRALAGSYEVVAAGRFLPAAETAEHAMRAVAAAFALAFQLAGPIVLASIVWQFALGLLSRLVPQLQVFFTAMPGQIGGGLVLLAMLGGGILAVWQEAMRATLSTLPGL